MIVKNVEELICALETFDAEQQLEVGMRYGKLCLMVGEQRTPIKIQCNLQSLSPNLT